MRAVSVRMMLVLLIGSLVWMEPELVRAGSPALAAATEMLEDGDQYFPDATGNRWQYRGQIIEGPLQKVAVQGFVNISTVKGEKTFKGVPLKVFHDTNPGNHGPSDSFYRRDAAGIVYYGSQPGTPLEKQSVPYQIVRFPLQYPSSFQQFDRRGLDLGNDLDGDGKNEQTDIDAFVTVAGRESVSVVAGAYPDAVRIEARMRMRIHLSGSGRTVVGTDTMTAWFARGVGLIKYVERQEIPPVKTDRGWTTEIIEELEEVKVKKVEASLDRCESASDCALADEARQHELAQIVFPSGLGAHPR